MEEQHKTGAAGRRLRIAVTGGIACGKSLFSQYLNKLGVETLDADEIVHGLVPEAERRELARKVFDDPAARAALEARIHPLVRRRLDEWEAAGDAAAPGGEDRSGAAAAPLRASVIPLLFEVRWDGKYDIICTVVCERSEQVSRMMKRRGLTREAAEKRLAAQMPASEKAAKSHYVIRNDGSPEELEGKAAEFVSWLRRKEKDERRV